MGRWQPDSHSRLEQAALALYSERGFDQTTVAEIAARAGLTERTFFRHFADKREVLFWGQAMLEEALEQAIAAAPACATPLATIAGALESVGALLEERRELARQRKAVIDANPALQERELLKRAALAAATTAALRQRGVAESTARLTAEAGMAIFSVAFARWLDDAEQRTLVCLIRDSLEQLRAVAAGVEGEPRRA